MAKRLTTALVLSLALTLAPAGAAFAEDIAFKKIMRNAAYGGAVGGLVGLALLAFVDNPGDHFEFVTTGAAAGILVGAGWGIYDTSNSYVSIDKDGIHTAFAPPLLEQRRLSSALPQRDVMLSQRLVGVRF